MSEELSAVKERATRARRQPRRRGIRTPDVLDAVREAEAAGVTQREIADAAGVTERTIQRWLSEESA